MSEPTIVRARFDASRHQNLTEWRLSRDLEDFENTWEATRRKQMLAGMQPPRWKKIAVWSGVIAGCALAWAGIIWTVLALGDWLAVRL